jgi:WD40 repeat protein
MFSPDDTMLLSGGENNGKLQLYDAAVWLEQVELPRVLDGYCPTMFPAGQSICFSPDSLSVLAIAGISKLQLWSVASGEVLQTFEDSSRIRHSSILTCSFSQDGSLVLSGNSAGSLTVWAAATGKVHRATIDEDLRQYDPEDSPLLQNFPGRLLSETDPERIEEFGERDSFDEEETYIGVGSACFFPDGRTVLATREDGKVEVWG